MNNTKIMKKLIHPIVLALCLLLIAPGIYSQVLVSDNPAATADDAAMLDIQSTDKGLLIPRMTEAQRNNISDPPTGLIVYQTDNTPGMYHNTGTPLSPDWQLITDATVIGGYWTQSGSDLYYTGNVGVNNTAPASDLDVDGSIWSSDSLYVTGRPGKLFINGQTLYEPTIRFGYEGTSLFKLHVDAPGTVPYLSVTADPYEDLWGVSDLGRVWHDYLGSQQAYVLLSSADVSTLYIDNDNPNTGARGINVAVSDGSATNGTLAIGGWNMGEGSGVYGENDNYGNFGYLGTDVHGAYGEYMTATVGNRGALGSEFSGSWGTAALTGHTGRLGLDGTGTDWGVYGEDGAATDPNFGGIGTSNYGVYGEYNTENFWGVLGADFAAVYGQLGGVTQNLDDGDFAVVGRGVDNSSELGNSYALGNQIGGVKGYNTQGVAYSAGVAGFTESNPDNRASGVFGGFANANEWGALGYEESGGNRYGGYFTNTTTGSGKGPNDPSSSIGIGVHGDLFGAHIHGSVYGLFTEGANYGLYASGDVYRTGADIHLQQDDYGQNNVMYTLVSPEMTVQTYGIGQLQNGKASVSFDDAFAGIVSDAEPIIVTITPIGNSDGVFLEKVDARGFSVNENNGGKSNVQFSWIAIGKRKGFENKSLPEDVIASDYTGKIASGLVNDSDISRDGQGLYYQNGRLITGEPPQDRTGMEITVEPAPMLERFVVPDKAELRKAPASRETTEKGTDKLNK